MSKNTESDLPAQSHNEAHIVLQRHSLPPNNTHRLGECLMPWSWSCVQVNADPGECYLQVLSSADIQAGDVLDPLIDPIHNRMLKCSEPGADGQDRVKPRLSNQFNHINVSESSRIVALIFQ